MRDEPRTTALDRDRAIWRSHARTGHLLNIVVVLIDSTYVLATWNSGSHRPLLLGLNVLGLFGLIAAYLVVPEEKMAASAQRDLIFFVWMLTAVTLVTTAAWADGGIRSPLAWLLPISVMFTAVPIGLPWCGSRGAWRWRGTAS